jgi:hypothetical protein
MNIKALKKALPYLNKANVATLVWGRHGIGKSQAIRQYCDENGLEFIDLRLGTQDVGDLLGLADFKKDGKGNNIATKFMQPEWFPTDPESEGVIFMDEINRARRDVLQAVFQLVIDKKLHTYKLPVGWQVIAACNPNTEDYIVTDIGDKAFMDRFCHIKLNPSPSEWIEFAEAQGFDFDIINFIKSQPELLEIKGEDFTYDEIKPSRRSWDTINRLRKIETPVEILKELCFGIVGTAATTAFVQSLNNSDKPFTAEDILNNFGKIKSKIKKYSDHKTGGRGDLIKHSADNLLKHLQNTKEKVSKEEAKNALSFVKSVPMDIGFDLARNLYMVDSIREYMDNDKELEEFLTSTREAMNK